MPGEKLREQRPSAAIRNSAPLIQCYVHLRHLMKFLCPFQFCTSMATYRTHGLDATTRSSTTMHHPRRTRLQLGRRSRESVARPPRAHFARTASTGLRRRLHLRPRGDRSTGSSCGIKLFSVGAIRTEWSLRVELLHLRALVSRQLRIRQPAIVCFDACKEAGIPSLLPSWPAEEPDHYTGRDQEHEHNSDSYASNRACAQAFVVRRRKDSPKVGRRIDKSCLRHIKFRTVVIGCEISASRQRCSQHPSNALTLLAERHGQDNIRSTRLHASKGNSTEQNHPGYLPKDT